MSNAKYVSLKRLDKQIPEKRELYKLIQVAILAQVPYSDINNKNCCLFLLWNLSLLSIIFFSGVGTICFRFFGAINATQLSALPIQANRPQSGLSYVGGDHLLNCQYRYPLQAVPFYSLHANTPYVPLIHPFREKISKENATWQYWIYHTSCWNERSSKMCASLIILFYFDRLSSRLLIVMSSIGKKSSWSPPFSSIHHHRNQQIPIWLFVSKVRMDLDEVRDNVETYCQQEDGEVRLLLNLWTPCSLEKRLVNIKSKSCKIILDSKMLTIPSRRQSTINAATGVEEVICTRSIKCTPEKVNWKS